MYFAFIKNEAIHQAQKNKNKYPGFLLGRIYVIMGKSNITNAAPAQLTPVEKGMMLGCTI